MALSLNLGGRTVAQIAVSGGNDTEDSYIVVLCSDGTIWRYSYKVGATWEKIDPVPST